MAAFRPTDEQLKEWGISREKYVSLYDTAEKTVASQSKKWYLPKFLEYSVGDVNKYLYEQMVKTKGAYAKQNASGLDAVAGADRSIKNPSLNRDTTPTTSTPQRSTASRVSTSVAVPKATSVVTPEEASPWYYSGNQIASRFGINNDYASILKTMQDATDAKYNELDTTASRQRDESLRTMEGQYNQYLQTLREQRANSVASGITKGTAAANQLTAMIAGQQGVSAEQQRINDIILDLAKQRETESATNKVTATNTSNEIGQYLANLAAQYEGNAIDRMAAQLQAQTARDTASIQAAASTKAAQINADSGVKSQDWLLNTIYGGDISKYYNDYVNYALNKKAIDAQVSAGK